MLTTVNSLKSPGGKLKISHPRNIVVVGGNSEKLLNSKWKENAELIGFSSIVNNRPGKMNNQPGEIPNKLLKSDIVIDTIWLSRNKECL